jgi:Domain of unknown function (DUF4252)
MSDSVRSAIPRSSAAARRRPLPGALIFVLVAVALAPLVGCTDMPHASAIEREVERQLPMATFSRETHVHLGPFSLWLAKGIVRMTVPEDADGRQTTAMLREIRSVEVDTYRVDSLPPLSEVELPADLEGRLASSGWSRLVRVAKDGELSLVLTHQGRDDSIDALLVVALESHELSIVRVDGRLDRAIAMAISSDPKGAFGQRSRRREPEAVAAAESGSR